MDDRPYFYRVRGRTLGPLDLHQMRHLAKRAQLGRATDVSRDGLQWSKAADLPELFAAHSEAASEPVAVSHGTGLPAGSRRGGTDTDPQAAVAEPRWYYTSAGIQQGPVDLATLRQLVASGAVPPHEHVIPEGGSQWFPVPSVPQLGGGVPDTAMLPPIDTSATAGSRGRPEHQGVNGLAIAGFAISLVAACCFLPGLVFLPLLGLAMIVVPLLAVIATTLSACGLALKTPSQRGLAVAGIVIGVLALLIDVALWILAAIGFTIGMHVGP